ncbi:MAG: hypothetical protein ACI83O_000745 [Patescibacteria group bacterium]|jgi:hypothetical protein
MASIKGYDVKFYVLLFIRLMLLFGVLLGARDGRTLILFVSLLGLSFTFLPFCCMRLFRHRIPADFEMIVLLSVFGVLMFIEDRLFIGELVWMGYVLHFGAAIILGFLALSIFYVLDNEEVIRGSPLFILLFTFSFVFSLVGIWELLTFVIGMFFGFGMHANGLYDSMIDLLLGASGGLVIGLWGFWELRSGNRYFMSQVVLSFMKKYFGLISRGRKYFEYSSRHIERLIEKGEGDRLEFKSTLRYNLHTGIHDKKIEHAVLKTLVGYLNTKGGTLLVGVGDSGSVLGIEKDGFVNHDKLKLYVTSILKENLGSAFLSYIDFELYPYKDTHVLKIECKKSKKRVFLKWAGKEEFFVRHGASTIQLEGNSLLDYVREHFG